MAMGFAGYDPNYAQNRRRMLDEVNAGVEAAGVARFGPGAGQAGTGLMGSYMSSPDFSQGEGWMNALYANREAQLRSRNDETWREVAAARGLDPTDGPIVQGSNQSLADQLSNLDAARLQGLIGMRQGDQSLAWQKQQAATADKRWREQQDFAEREYRDRQQAARGAQSMAQQYYQEGASPGGAPGIYDRQSSTGSVTGEPGVPAGYGQTGSLASHRDPVFGPKKAPDRVFTETVAQAAARGANLDGKGGGMGHEAGHGVGLDYSGSKNTGGYLVPGVSGAGPSVSSLQHETPRGMAAQYATQGAGSMAGGANGSRLPQYGSDRRY